MNKYANQIKLIANKLRELLDKKGNNSQAIAEQVFANQVEQGQLIQVLNYYTNHNNGKYICELLLNGKFGTNDSSIFNQAIEDLINLRDATSLYTLVAKGRLTVEQVQNCCKIFNTRQLVKLNQIIKDNNYGYTLKYSSGIPLSAVGQNVRKSIDADIYQYFVDNRIRKHYQNDNSTDKASYWFENVGQPFNKHIQILKNNGITMIQQDGQEWQGMLVGGRAYETFRLADKETLCPINNAMLVFNWYTDESHTQYPVQINSYLS